MKECGTDEIQREICPEGDARLGRFRGGGQIYEVWGDKILISPRSGKEGEREEERREEKEERKIEEQISRVWEAGKSDTLVLSLGRETGQTP